jgi:hypothetical protein
MLFRAALSLLDAARSRHDNDRTRWRFGRV